MCARYYARQQVWESEQHNTPAFLDTKWVVGQIKDKGVNQQNKYTTINCDKSYKENLKAIMTENNERRQSRTSDQRPLWRAKTWNMTSRQPCDQLLESVPGRRDSTCKEHQFGKNIWVLVTERRPVWKYTVSEKGGPTQGSKAQRSQIKSQWSPNYPVAEPRLEVTRLIPQYPFTAML